jgi:nucleoprotein TPR
VYQATRGGGAGRGRGNPSGQRGGMNAGTQSFSPSGPGPTGQKRPREEGSIGGQGNAGKRPRGGGQNN